MQTSGPIIFVCVVWLLITLTIVYACACMHRAHLNRVVILEPDLDLKDIIHDIHPSDTPFMQFIRISNGRTQKAST